MITVRGTTYLSRIEMAFVAGAATALAVVAPTAHADQDSDFLGCLANHDVTYKDKVATLKLSRDIQQDLRQLAPEAEVFHLEQNGLTHAVAQVDVECVQASEGSNTAHANTGSACSADPNMDCRADPSGYLDQLHTAGINGNSDQTLLTVGQQSLHRPSTRNSDCTGSGRATANQSFLDATSRKCRGGRGDNEPVSAIDARRQPGTGTAASGIESRRVGNERGIVMNGRPSQSVSAKTAVVNQSRWIRQILGDQSLGLVVRMRTFDIRGASASYVAGRVIDIAESDGCSVYRLFR